MCAAKLDPETISDSPLPAAYSLLNYNSAKYCLFMAKSLSTGIFLITKTTCLIKSLRCLLQDVKF